MGQLARLLIVFGLLSLAIAALLIFAPKLPLLGRLPGDVLFRRGDTTIYIPIATSIILSVLLTFLLNLFWR